MEAGEIGRKEPCQTVSGNPRLPTEMDGSRDPGFPDLQPVDITGFREGGDRRQVCRLHRPVITFRVVDPDVVAVRVSVGGVVLGYPVNEGRLHAAPWPGGGTAGVVGGPSPKLEGVKGPLFRGRTVTRSRRRSARLSNPCSRPVEVLWPSPGRCRCSARHENLRTGAIGTGAGVTDSRRYSNTCFT